MRQLGPVEAVFATVFWILAAPFYLGALIIYGTVREIYEDIRANRI